MSMCDVFVAFLTGICSDGFVTCTSVFMDYSIALSGGFALLVGLITLVRWPFRVSAFYDEFIHPCSSSRGPFARRDVDDSSGLGVFHPFTERGSICEIIYAMADLTWTVICRARVLVSASHHHARL